MGDTRVARRARSRRWPLARPGISRGRVDAVEASARSLRRRRPHAESREAADERIERLNSAIGKEEDGHAAEEVAFASLAARQRAVSTAANDCRARGDALRAQLESTTEERDEYQNSVIKLEQQLKEAKDERDAATKAAGVIQAKLDAANEDIEKNAVILEEKDVFIKTLIQTPKGK